MQRADYFRVVQGLGLHTSDYIVIGSGILCALGIRAVDDVDLIVAEPVFRSFEKTGHWKRKDFDDGSYYLLHDMYEIGLDWDSPSTLPNLADLKTDEQVIDGVPFVSLQRLKGWKQKRGRDKDLVDIALIDEYLSRA